MKKALTLVEIRQTSFPKNPKPVYAIMLDGKQLGELCFHMRGYTGPYLPQPDGTPLYVGETSLRNWRRMIARLNREYAVARRSASAERRPINQGS